MLYERASVLIAVRGCDEHVEQIFAWSDGAY